MTDISGALNALMQKENYSSTHAFYLLGGDIDESRDKPIFSVSEPVHAETDEQQYQLGTRHRGRKGIYPYAKRECNSYGQRSK